MSGCPGSSRSCASTARRHVLRAGIDSSYLPSRRWRDRRRGARDRSPRLGPRTVGAPLTQTGTKRLRGRHQYFLDRGIYINDIIGADDSHTRPSNFIFVDILEYLIRIRKERIEFNQEGYVTIGKLVNEMSRLGYDEGDANSAIVSLVKKGMIEPESLVDTSLTRDEPVRAHASGYVHSRLLLRQDEYLVGVTTAIKIASKETATDM